MKLYYALLPDPDLEYNLEECQGKLKSKAQAHWINPDFFHLTLAYLGECSPALLPSLEHSLMEMPLPSEVWVEKSKLQVLEQESYQSLALSWEEDSEVRTLRKVLLRTLGEAGIKKGEFISHISLARAKEWNPAELGRLQLPRCGSFKSIALIRSLSNGMECSFRILAQRKLGHLEEWEEDDLFV